MATCLIIQPIHPAGIERLERANMNVRMASSDAMSTVAQEITDVDAVITRSAGLTAHAMHQAANLKVIGSHGVGVNAIDIACANALGIPIVNTPHSNVNAVAELTVSLMLAVMKQLRQADSATRASNFRFKYSAHIAELTGKTVGIVGFGHIAKRTITMLKHAFQMEVLVYSPSAQEAELVRYGASKVTLADLLVASDVISLHVPLTLQTHHLIGAAELAQMKQSAVLINTSRGDVVDETALVAALEAGHLAGVGLDVYHSETMPAHHPLLHLENAVLTPHIGGSSQEALERTALAVCEQVIDVLNHNKPAYLVNEHIWQNRRFQR